jgi:hypothetical protein
MKAADQNQRGVREMNRLFTWKSILSFRFHRFLSMQKVFV